MTSRVENQKYTTNNHDVGFIINCSFGNGYRLTHNESYKMCIRDRYWDDANWTDLPNTECTENRLDKIEFTFTPQPVSYTHLKLFTKKGIFRENSILIDKTPYALHICHR